MNLIQFHKFSYIQVIKTTKINRNNRKWDKLI